MMYARRGAEVRYAAPMHGTSVMPSLRAASTTPVPGDDPVLAVDQDRVGETDFSDATGALRDPSVAMRPRVAGVGDQRLDGAHDDVHRSARSGSSAIWIGRHHHPDDPEDR
jgi:hypothetical protein